MKISQLLGILPSEIDEKNPTPIRLEYQFEHLCATYAQGSLKIQSRMKYKAKADYWSVTISSLSVPELQKLQPTLNVEVRVEKGQVLLSGDGINIILPPLEGVEGGLRVGSEYFERFVDVLLSGKDWSAFVEAASVAEGNDVTTGAKAVAQGVHVNCYGDSVELSALNKSMVLQRLIKQKRKVKEGYSFTLPTSLIRVADKGHSTFVIIMASDDQVMIESDELTVLADLIPPARSLRSVIYRDRKLLPLRSQKKTLKRQ